MSNIDHRLRATGSVYFLSNCNPNYLRTKGMRPFFLHSNGIFRMTCVIGVVIGVVLLHGCSNPPGGGTIEPVTFAYECMVRALDRRIRVKLENDPKWTDLCGQQAAYDTSQGLLLTQPFYQLLANYEESGKPFDQYLPLLLKKLPEYNP